MHMYLIQTENRSEAVNFEYGLINPRISYIYTGMYAGLIAKVENRLL